MNEEREKIIGAIEVWQKNRLTSFTPRDILYDFGDQIIAALRIPADGEAHAEILRLRDAKRRALAIADERAKENVALRAALEAIARTTFSGSDTDEKYMQGNYDAHAVCASMARAALSNAPPASEGVRWRPIETAPKDMRIQLMRVKMPKFQNLPDILWIKVGSWRAHFADSYQEGWREDAVAGPSATDQYKLMPSHWCELPPVPSISTIPVPAATPDEGPDPLGYAKGERDD